MRRRASCSTTGQPAARAITTFIEASGSVARSSSRASASVKRSGSTSTSRRCPSTCSVVNGRSGATRLPTTHCTPRGSSTARLPSNASTAALEASS